MTVDAVRVGDRLIGAGHPTYVIAELSGNHNGSLDRARQLVEQAADAGADAVKLQTYRADTITIDESTPPFIIGPGSPWAGRRLYDLYAEAATPWEWTEDLFELARSRGIDAFSSPFDETAIELLERFDPPAYKIASFELPDLGLVAATASTGRPLFLSTGMASRAEIGEAVTVARDAGAAGVVLLKCTSSYPAPPDEMNLRTIPDLATTFEAPVGLSDHTLDDVAAIAAVTLGAAALEKHLTLSRADGGPDSGFSLEPAELRRLIASVRTAEDALGTVRYGPTAAEKASVPFRRSLFAVRDIEAGAEITPADVRSIRPGDGLAPKHLPAVIGRHARQAIPRGTPLTWELLDGPLPADTSE